MKASLFDLNGKSIKEIALPSQFHEGYRPDVIQRAFVAQQSHGIQPRGTFFQAGKRAEAKLSRRRRDFRGAYGHGISRVPRKSLWNRGTQFGWVGAFAPSTVGGYRAHPPKPERIWNKHINDKERLLAIRSALGASASLQLVKEHGHRVQHAPLIISNDAEQLKKTADVVALLEKIGFSEELERCDKRKIRAGKGKLRGRKYKRAVGPLMVVSKTCALEKAGRNVPGVEVVRVNQLNIGILAPGGRAGRAILFTEDSLKRLEQEKLYKEKGIPNGRD